jgi:hypothetical protein
LVERWEMTMTIDDAAILKRAKQLCRDDGVAWDRFSATSTGARVLNDKDRREGLMRAREELVADAIETGASQAQIPAHHTAEERKESEVSSDQSATFWPRRRVA